MPARTRLSRSECARMVNQAPCHRAASLVVAVPRLSNSKRFQVPCIILGQRFGRPMEYGSSS
jgi:hypothetical protein